MGKNPEALAEIARAEKTLLAAKSLYESDFYEDSLSRCYYAVLHAGKSVLLEKGINAKSHEALKRLFGKELIEPNEIEKDYAIIFREEQDERLLADYDITFVPEPERVKERIEDAQKFIDRMKKYLGM